MTHLKLSDPAHPYWLTSRIGWLSVCIIAAAWGNRLLPGDYQDIWGTMGVFGLAAALGLASIAAARHRLLASSAARSADAN